MLKKFFYPLVILTLVLFMNPMSAKAAVLPWEAMVNSTFTSGTHRSPGFDDPNNRFAYSMVTFNDYVYVSNFNIATGTEIWRSNNGTDWDQVNVDNFDDVAFLSFATLAVFNNNLYAFNWIWNETQVDVYRYGYGGGTSWTNIATINDVIAPTAAAVYDNSLYIGLSTGSLSAVYSANLTDDTTWTLEDNPGFDDPNNNMVQSMATFNNNLYAGILNTTSGSEVWSFNGSTWIQDNNDGFDGGADGIDNISTGSLTSFNGALYASTDNSDTGAEVWKTAGSGPGDWVKVPVAGGFGQGSGTSCIYPGGGSAVFKNKLYIGATGANGAEVFRTSDGTSWEQVNADGFGYPDNLFVIFTVLGDYIYAGTGTWDMGPDTTEIYRYYEPTIETLPQTGPHIE